MTHEVMHVGIEEPIQNRKDLLNIAVDAIQALKEFEMHKKVNKEKDVYRKHFIQVIKELNDYIGEFKEKIPKAHISEEREEAIKPTGKSKVEIILKKPFKKIPKTHLDKLEDDIASLRDKIASL